MNARGSNSRTRTDRDASRDELQALQYSGSNGR